jgi:predicted ATP-dependent endonuclease of OLD family
VTEAVGKSLELLAVEMQNLRSFEQTELRLDRPITVLVGPNNAGKTSVLRMLDWVFNAPISELDHSPMSHEAIELLRPARNTRNKARRLTLVVRVLDGRRHSRFRCENGIARLRIGLRVSPEPRIRVNLGPPTRSEGGERDPNAYELLEELRSSIRFRLIPASRDASSSSFETTFHRSITDLLATGATNTGRGRAKAEYRTVSQALKNVQEVAEDLVEPLWREMQGALPAGMAKTGSIEVDAQPGDLVEWIASVLRLRLSTGPHDINSVRPTEVGSGLQSLLELSLAEGEAAAGSNVLTITALEEPEAFLHPAAQRTLARRLFQSVPGQRIVSTHSPILVEEAEYGDVVLVHEHQFNHPDAQTDENRRRINTALLTRYGAEMVFSAGVLLVEGESDREFFEGLRRRLATFDRSGSLDKLMAIPTGSKDHFGPWIRLIRSYRSGQNPPLNWLAVVDGDAPRSIRRAFKDAKVAIDPQVRVRLNELAAANGQEDRQVRLEAARKVNASARSKGVRLAVCSADLEWAMVSSLSDETATSVAAAMDLKYENALDLAMALGSKHSLSPGNLKEPWRRAVIAREIPFGELSGDARQILQRWFRQVMSQKAAGELIEAAISSESAP